MPLELKPPLMPMEALSVETIPEGSSWQYEPKWDGFRCLVFREGDQIDLQSKAGQPLARYFPELVAATAALRAQQFVLDSEIVIPEGQSVSFDSLLLRLHPAESRVRKLAAQTPGLLIVFDLLCDERGRSLLHLPLAERRRCLENFSSKYLSRQQRFRLSPMTLDPNVARKWLRETGGSLDGVIAKRRDLPYQTGERTGMQKVKVRRAADCVIGGFRYGSKNKLVGSLLLGLYDEQGLLHHVGFTSSIKAADRPKLTQTLESLIQPPGFTGRAPGGPSRWSTERSGEWNPVQPKLVVEVEFDHFSGGRFRHGTKFLRWRPDKAPRQCTFDQVRQTGSTLQLLAA